MRKHLLIVLLAVISILSLSVGLTACSNKIEYGKSAYDLYKELYIQENGSEDGLLSLSDWLLSLKGETGEQGNQGLQGNQGIQGEQGETGEDGKSAYELYVEAYIKATGSDDGALTEEEWLNSLRGERGESGVDGKSAYELYVEAYIKATGSDDGVLTEEEWLDSLHGATGVSIDKVEIICGDIIVYYDNDTSDILENMLPETGHNWDEGTITTNPTCITPGVITYTCNDCEATKKELTDANGEHRWGKYDYDDEYHWRTCKICGETEKHEHEFGGASKDSPVDELIECECGIHKTIGEFYSFKVTFECGDGVSVKIYDTQSYDGGGYISDVAYARDSETGELLNNGEGQVNFEVVLGLGYKLKSVSISSKNYKNLKDPSEIGRDNTYRITKITGELTVSIETEIDFLELPVMVINTENSAPILDKENYVNCKVSVLNAEEDYCFENIGAGIRGRGNTTWDMPKKPYRLKFDSKFDLFGNGQAKSWTLIANYSDPSLIRNYLAYTLGAEFEGIKDTTTTVQFVELYLNGQYDGVYLICEQNEVGTTRVDIEDDFSKATNPADMGYLLELDARAPSEGMLDKDYFIWVDGTNYAIKSPDYEDANENVNYNNYVNYIKDYMYSTWNALSSNDYKSVCDYIDVNSFADSFIVHELFKMCDVGFSSFYIYKKPNEKIFSGPIWDFDISCGNCDYNESSNANTIWTTVQNNWYRMLLQYEEFQQLVSLKLSSYNNIIITKLTTELQNISKKENSFLRNFKRWDILGTYVWPNTEAIVAITTWEGQVEYVKEWLLNSLNNLMFVYCS